MGVKQGPELTVDYLITQQMVAHAAFWDAFPPGTLDDIRADVEVAAADARDKALGVDCGGCGGTIRQILTPAHNCLWERVAAAAAAGVTLDGLAAFVAGKRGYRPAAIRVYYKGGDGRTHRFTF